MLKNELARLLKQGSSEEKLEKLLEALDTNEDESEIILEGQSKEFYQNRLENAKNKLNELRAKLGSASTPEKQASINAQIERQTNLIGEYQSKFKNAAQEAANVTPTNESSQTTKFTVKFVNQGGKEESLEIVAPSEEEARKKTLDMVDIKPDGIISVEKREDLEPAIIPTKEPENYEKNIEKKEGDVNMENKKEALKSVTESLDSIFDLLRQDLNEEEFTDKGDEAAEPVATEERDPKEDTPDQDNKELFPADEHKEVEEVKEVVVEEVTSKGDEAAEPVATEEKKPEEAKPEIDTADVFPSEEHKEAEEVKEVVVESENSDTAEKAAEEVEKAGDADELNDAGSDTVDEKGELITQPEEVDPEKVRSAIQESEISGEIKGTEIKAEAKNDDLFPADEHKEAEEVKEVMVESRVYLENSIIKVEIPFDSQETFINDLSGKEQEVVQEALRSIYAAITGSPLNEDIDIPEDTEAEIKLYEDKVTIDIPVKTYKEDLTEEDLEFIQEALEVLDALLKEELEISGEIKGTEIKAEAKNDDLFPSEEHKEAEEVKEVVVEEVTSKGEVAAEPVATKEAEGTVLTPDQDNKDVFPTEEHTEVEEVKEVVVEQVTSKGDEAAKPVATKEGDGSIMTPSIDSKDVFPTEEHTEVEEVKEVIVESEKEELNDANSDTVNDDGQIKDSDHKESEPSKAEVSDVTTDKEKVEFETAQEDPEEVEPAKPATVSEAVNYKSVKEAFLLESDYFEKDSYALVSAADKQAKLEKQMALLVARDSQDPLYEELVRTTALAKKLQEQLQERYNLFGKEKAAELKTLKHEIDSDGAKLPKFNYDKKDVEGSSIDNKELFDIENQKEDVKEIIVESVQLNEKEIVNELSEFVSVNESFFSYIDQTSDENVVRLLESLDEEEIAILTGILENADQLILEGKTLDKVKRAGKKIGKVAGKVARGTAKGIAIAGLGLSMMHKDTGATKIVAKAADNYATSQVEKAKEKSEKESATKYDQEKDQYNITVDQKKKDFEKTGDSSEVATQKAKDSTEAHRTEEQAKKDSDSAKKAAGEDRAKGATVLKGKVRIADVPAAKLVSKAAKGAEEISSKVHEVTGTNSGQTGVTGGMFATGLLLKKKKEKADQYKKYATNTARSKK